MIFALIPAYFAHSFVLKKRRNLAMKHSTTHCMPERKGKRTNICTHPCFLQSTPGEYINLCLLEALTFHFFFFSTFSLIPPCLVICPCPIYCN